MKNYWKIERMYRELMLLVLLSVAYSSVWAQKVEKPSTYYVYADSLAYYERPAVDTAPVGFYYWGDTIEARSAPGVSVILPLVASDQFDQEYWDGERDPQFNQVTGGWLEINSHGNRVYLPRLGVSTLQLLEVDESKYSSFEEILKEWLLGYVGAPIDSIHVDLPKVEEEDTHESYRFTYAKQVELCIENEYTALGIGGSAYHLYLPDMKLLDAYWWAVGLFSGAEYGQTKWTTVCATDDRIQVARYWEGQTLEITVTQDKEGIRVKWNIGGC